MKGVCQAPSMGRPALAVLAVLSGAGLSGAADLPALRVGMDTRTPPWSFIQGVDFSKEDFTATPSVTEAQLKKLVGLDVDVANALGRRLEVGLKIVPVSWFDLEKGLIAKRYDLIVNSWTPSRKTPASILASAPYFEWGLLIAVRADNNKVRTYKDLSGVTVGHYRDPAVELTLRSMGAGHLVPHDAPETLFEDLRKGTLAAIVFDSVYVRWRVANDPAFRAVGEPLNRLGYHVGVRKADADLYEKVQAALRSLLSSGEMGEIRRRWEGPAPK